LPANPAPQEIDRLRAFLRDDDMIQATEEIPGQFQQVKIREPFLKALESLK
jgi:hypothetical protein